MSGIGEEIKSQMRVLLLQNSLMIMDNGKIETLGIADLHDWVVVDSDLAEELSGIEVRMITNPELAYWDAFWQRNIWDYIDYIGVDVYNDYNLGKREY